jgi:hypothetical protein
MLPFDLREAVGHEPVQERRADCGVTGAKRARPPKIMRLLSGDMR